jgi:hypothetical protein
VVAASAPSVGVGMRGQSADCELWRRSGRGRLPGGVVRSVSGVIVRVGLLELVVEQVGLVEVGLVVRHAGWSDWRRGGLYAEVVQDPGHCGGRRDQGEQHHLRLAAGTFEPSDTERSKQQARPG